MYRQRGGGFPIVGRVIILGVIIGVIYAVYQGLTRAPDPTSTPVAVINATVAPAVTLEINPVTPTITPIQTTILIPSAGILANVITVYPDGESWNISNLGQNVGHLLGTGWFDSPGNIVLSGHVEMSDGRPGVFAPIRDMETGEEIILTYGETEYRYITQEVRRVEPTDLSVLMPTPQETLTLITCDAYDFLSDQYQERVVVIASRVQIQ